MSAEEYNQIEPDPEVLTAWLSYPADGELSSESAAADQLEQLYRHAREVCLEECGRGVLLRGIVEFSNYCRNTCIYCGLRNANRGVCRYRMRGKQVLAAVENIYRQGIRTVVLQSGEDPALSDDWLARVIGSIKERFDMAVTLSVGEWPYHFYRKWRDAGADRFLLKIETTDRDLYERLHPGMSFKNRLSCLRRLFELGYQNGSGIITGLPGQTLESIARDILWLYERDFDMISIGPFVPHPGTPIGGSRPGTAELTCRAIALTRILTRNAHMPATTALAAGQIDLRSRGLLAGANVIMPNFTPPRYAVHYDIYPEASRGSVRTEIAGCAQTDSACVAIEAAGRVPDFSRGDSLKSRIEQKEGAST